MATRVTVGSITYWIEKRDDGNIRVTHAAGQTHPMRGPDTEGVHAFEVHPCQTHAYAYWNGLLPPDQRQPTGPGRDGAIPWWSSKGWKRKGTEGQRD